METDSPLCHLKESEFFPECWKTLLNGVVAFVDVRTGSDNRSKSVANELERLGAKVATHFSKKVTHVVFKDGSKPIYDKAKALGIPIVSYLWIVACKEKGEVASVEGHAAINSQDYDSPFFKWRKVKSMQPKELDEELKLVEKKLDRRRKKLRQSLQLPSNKHEVPLPYTPIIERKSIIDALIESSPLVQERIHKELAAGKTCEDVFTVNEKEEDDFDTFFDTPLMLKFISKNYYSPRDPPPLSVRRILSEVRQSKSSATTPSVNSSVRKMGELSSQKTPSDEQLTKSSSSPLCEANAVQNTNKRKTRSSLSSVAKKRKENTEDVTEKFPRRKLLFQSKAIAQLPQDPLVALTPEESPKPKKNHPCFTQATLNLRSQVRRRSCDDQNLHNEISASPRRDSLADFKIASVKKRSDQKVSTPTVVCTSIHSESLAQVEKAIEQLKGMKLIETVNDTTTHVVCGDLRRTLNVMRGVVRGVKIVKLDWVIDSMAQDRWLEEDKYLVERFSVAASLYSRKKRLFGNFDPIFVSSKSRIPPRDLCDIIKCAGGELTTVSKKAALIIGQWKPEANVPCVTGTWILDSVEKGLTLPLTDYLITS